MVGLDIVERLGVAFPKSILNTHLEFIADPHHSINSYFILANCNTEEDVIAKLLEWLSREAYKSQHFNSDARNKQVHKYYGIKPFETMDGVTHFICGKWDMIIAHPPPLYISYSCWRLQYPEAPRKTPLWF